MQRLAQKLIICRSDMARQIWTEEYKYFSCLQFAAQSLVLAALKIKTIILLKEGQNLIGLFDDTKMFY